MTALEDINSIQYTYEYVTESSYDKVTLISNTTTILNAVSGTLSKTTNSTKYSLKKGEKITLLYHTDVSNNVSGEKVNIWFTIPDPIVEMVQNGSEQKLVARKVLKGYVGVNGVAKLFYNFTPISYSGNFIEKNITLDNKPYTLYTITSSGILKINKTGPFEFWICGGGGPGGSCSGGTGTSPVTGGGGGGGYFVQDVLDKGEYEIVIGAQGGTSSISNPTPYKLLFSADYGKSPLNPNNYTGGDGGSGGGGGGGKNREGKGGSGCQKNTTPFYTTHNYLVFASTEAHCAGGGGGGCLTFGVYVEGGDGGDYGVNGSWATYDGSSSGAGRGGTKGGGCGGYPSDNNATFYGGGGGGGGSYAAKAGSLGSGYQGVMYLLVPDEES